VARSALLFYGFAAYGVSAVTFLYLVGFVGDLLVPKTVDSGPEASRLEVLLVDTFLLALFAGQHSMMARKGFKKWWTKIVPSAIERSTYTLVSSLFLLVLFWQWRPDLTLVWDIPNPMAQRILEALFWLGWLIAIHSTFLTDHADLFGLRQVLLFVRGRPYTPPKFKMRELYRHVRHPIMMGLLISLWATPAMTLGRLIFALGMTAYIVLGIRLEERDLVETYGEAYREYRRRVPMILPLPRFLRR